MANFGCDVEIEKLKQLCWNNAEYYKKDESENGQRLRLGFLGVVDHVNAIIPLVNSIEKVMSAYDFDKDTPGNGYRSFVIIVQASINHALQLCNYITVNRDSLIFRKGFYMKEVEAVSHMIASLATCFQHLQTLLSWSECGDLFASEEHNPETLLEKSGNINLYAFYGRCLGIQFCASVQPVLKFISTFMASFSEVYYNLGSFSARAQSLLSGGKFLIDPELRSRRIVNISQFASIDFCKAFWFLAESELMKKIPDFVCNAIAINTEIEIPPEPLEIEKSGGGKVEIPIPSSHIKVEPVQVRLLSSSKREGMIAVSSESSKKFVVVPPSDSLILHCHGGGFVAQSSKSHEVYLRDWASTLNVPIVSVDYSLAPEAPFPRALEEVFYAYCWALKNCHILGSTGRKIILAGDSAGANLVLGVALKCIEYDIKRPDGVFVAYVPVLVSCTPSPSRLLSLMDPLLPIGFLLRCLKAYACPSGEQIAKSKNQDETDAEIKSALRLNNELGLNYDKKLPIPECSGSTDDAMADILIAEGKEVEEALECGLDTDWENVPFGFADEGTSGVVDTSDKNYKNAFNSVKKRVSGLISNTFKMASKKDIDKTLTGTDIENLVNPFKEFQFSVPRDPYLSPYWAPDDILRQMPPTFICSVQFDPCLDDCVMFAKKLKRLGNVVRLDILEGLPHGFLNFSKVNKDAEEGSKVCVTRIQELLDYQRSGSGGSAGESKNGERGGQLGGGSAGGEENGERGGHVGGGS